MFSGAAAYYDRYRPPYPTALLRDLRREAAAGGTRLVDWGCGTGELTLPLGPSFDEVIAVDIDADMIAAARAKADQLGQSHVRWIVGSAESLALPDDSVDLIVAGSSFHWMDRGLLAGRAYRALTAGGAIGVAGGGSSVWDVTCEWHEVAVASMKRWLGEQRRAGSGTYAVAGRHEDNLRSAGFRLEHRRYRVAYRWSADSIVGYLYSTSFAGPAVLGDRRQSFEAELRAGLARLSPDDSFDEVLDYHLLIGRRSAPGPGRPPSTAGCRSGRSSVFGS